MTWNGREEEAEKQHFDAENNWTTVDSPFPATGAMAENSQKIREIRRAMHERRSTHTRAEEGSVAYHYLVA